MIMWETSTLIKGINILSISCVEFNRYTYSTTTSVINPKLINNILLLLVLRYARIETTARNWDIIKPAICKSMWYIMWVWETWGRINGTIDSEITILAIKANSFGLL